MIDHYQPFFLPFFGSRPSVPNPLVRQLYYWSWEDGLWDLLRAKQVATGSTILVPDFYCQDVVENIRAHGYMVVTYRLNAHFQIKIRTLINSIHRHKPAMVILFHACGIQNTITNRSNWIQRIPREVLVVEDAVHQLVDPSTVKPLSDRHFIMDSLRKVSPFPGSFLYGTKKGLDFHQSRKIWSPYAASSLLLYLLFRCTLILSHVTRVACLASFAHQRVLKGHDDIIGNSEVAHRGIGVFAWFAKWIHFAKIQRKKREQVFLYKKTMKGVYTKGSPFYPIRMKPSDYGKLHAFPVGLRGKMDERMAAYFTGKKIVVFPKFPESAWARKRDVLFLPLGFHIRKQDIKHIGQCMMAVKTGAWLREANVTHSPHFLMRAAASFLT